MILAATLWTVTAYGPQCGATGLTKAGTRPVAGHVIAADPLVLPIGSLVEIDGWPGVRQVHDIGSSIKGLAIDVFVDDCQEALVWGRQQRAVRVLHRPAERTGSGIKRTSERARSRESSAPMPLLVEGASGAGHLAQAGRERTAPGARAGLTEPAATHRALAGAPRAGALSTSSSEPIEARR